MSDQLLREIIKELRSMNTKLDSIQRALDGIEMNTAEAL